MIWISGPDKHATFFNRGWLDFTGRGIEHELGYGWVSAVHPDQQKDCLAGYASSFDERHLWQAECQFQRADGEYRWMLCTGAPRFAGDGTFEGYIISGSDITDLKSAQEASLARQKLESVGTLARGIAHDFNNLMGGMLAQADLALMEYKSGSSPEQELNVIRNVAIRGSEIVRQLMTYAGKESEALQLIDVSQTVAEMIELLKVSVSKDTRLEAYLGEGLPTVRASAAQLRQIVMNLVMNASQAIGDRGGVIRVSTGRRCSSGVISDRLAEGDYVQLEVSDTGCGMSKETQTKIFDPFFTTKSAGHGLGLALVDGIVRSLGGAIHVVSELAKGTSFKVLLPCVKTTADEIPGVMSSAGESVRPAQGMTVLVVEDEDPLRQAVVRMLRKTGFDVLEAANGSAAIDLLRVNGCKIDVILLDLSIPGPSSNEVVAEATRARPDIRIVVTSAYSREMLTPPLSAPQICHYIQKPFQLNDLVQRLRSSVAAAGEVR
jgi:PAS domain S-box-containing protein